MEATQRLTVEGQIYGILSQMYSSPEDTSMWCDLVVALRPAFALLDLPCALESVGPRVILGNSKMRSR